MGTITRWSQVYKSFLNGSYVGYLPPLRAVGESFPPYFLSSLRDQRDTRDYH